jgi:serine/threonine protein kinase/Flp pilus assembly protein TadD
MNHAVQTRDASAEALMGEVMDEFLERQGRGEQPDIEEYAVRYPQLAAVLRQMLPALRVMHVSATNHPRENGSLSTPIEPEGPLGDFRIVREVGRGGMGVVYEAVQISLGRRVALKVLPFAAALDAKQLQRFRNEAQAAAHLHHQSIVPVYYVGTERGVHFYAMQFIQGRTLAEVILELRSISAGGECPSASRVSSTGAAGAPGSAPKLAPTPDTLPIAGLSTECATRRPEFFRTIARLGVQAAEALEHAHQEGVVHRDIKPANLLVDGCGHLWITDFGLAHCQSQVGLTMTGDLVGTLRYMSPEQALAKRDLVDHRTDIYSLGATLYELLTLAPAIAGNDRQELLAQIAFEEPRPPRRLDKTIPPELETIVLKAMEKIPADRYATAQELADDLRRYLEDRPIRARRPTWLEQARKWARRHRSVVWSAAAASFVALAVLAGSAGWIVRDRAAQRTKVANDIQAALEEAQRTRKDGKLSQAQAAARRAETLLEEGVTNPALAERVRTLVLELTEEEADARLVARLEGLRLLQAEVNPKENHFLLKRALPDYREAFREYGLSMEVEPGEAAAVLQRRSAEVRATLVAAMDHWLILARHEKSAEADWVDGVLSLADADPWRRAVRAAREKHDREALEKLAREVDAASQPPEELFLLDMSLRQRGAKEGAVALLRRAQEAFPGDFWINHDLGVALRDCQPPQLNEAIRFLTVAVALRPQSPGARVNLGVALRNKGRLADAAAAYRHAIDLKPDYANAHRNLCHVLIEMGQFDEAVATWRRAIALDSSDVSIDSYLGVVLCRNRRYDDAAAVFRHAIEVKPHDAIAYSDLGNVLTIQGHLDEAIDACERSIDLKPDYAQGHHNLGVALDRKGRIDEAVSAYRDAILHDPDHAGAHYNLGTLFESQGRLSEAASNLHGAVELEPNHVSAWYNLGTTLFQMGRLNEAVAALRKARELKPDFAEAHCNLGLALERQGDFSGALAALKRGHALSGHQKDWHYPSAEWIRDCERLHELEAQLPAILKGDQAPGDAAEGNDCARLCHYKGHHVAAARLWVAALAAEPKLADDLRTGHCNEAACAAALASCGRGADASALDDKERVRWRKQAVEWLAADLTAAAKLLESHDPKDVNMVRRKFRIWQSNQDLVGLRDPATLAELPADEQEAYRRFWEEVEALLAKADAVK